jgi:hypothetical protein
MCLVEWAARIANKDVLFSPRVPMNASFMLNLDEE